MLVSVIICTIRRAGLVRELLECLMAQSYRHLEILVVGGSDAEAAREYETTVANSGLPLRFLTAEKGLSKARNVGLANAKGEIICFFDDDVAIQPDFFQRVVSEFQKPGMAAVGGLTAFDTLNYDGAVTVRWKLRRLLGITPSLEPGYCTELGRSIPFSFLRPFSGTKEVGWLPGFCQIFRERAIEGLRYDEHESVVRGFRCIAVEDRDFSMIVARTWKLVVIGDLFIEHRRDDEARPSNLPMTFRATYGLGRCFAIRTRSFRHRVNAVHVVAAEFVIDVLTALANPSGENRKIPWLRANAFWAGYQSARQKF
jgi:glycosyltransferase involved in cell wall biosynthesis